MDVAVATSLAAALLALAAGLLARRSSPAPGSWDRRPFAVLALSAAVYAPCSLASLLGTPDAGALWFARATPGLDLPYLREAALVAAVLAVAWVVTTRFVHGARALAALRAQLLRDLEARTRELAAAFDALHQSERLAALGRFASGLAHEVNSPAAVVTANLRYLQECSRGGALPADGHEALGDALASMQQINALVRKLLDAGRVASAPGAAASVSVAALAQEALADARRRLPAGGVDLVEDVPEELAVLAPREVLEQVLATLVANAAESIPEGRPGRIALRAERVAGLVRIAVSDDGAGMPPEVLRRAFDPFFTTKRAGGRGAGLGLAVARALVEGHGGALWLESSPGKGTTAHLELPEDAPEPAPSATPRPPPPGAREV